MNVSALRCELKARNVNYKGLKSQLVARLAKLLKAEAEKNEDAFKDGQCDPEVEMQEDKKLEVCFYFHHYLRNFERVVNKFQMLPSVQLILRHSSFA